MIEHLPDQILVEEASRGAFVEHSEIKAVLILSEDFEGDGEASTLRLLERLDLCPPESFALESLMRQSDGLNDDSVRRYSELQPGTDFDLVPAVPDSAKEVATPGDQPLPRCPGVGRSGQLADHWGQLAGDEFGQGDVL